MNKVEKLNVVIHAIMRVYNVSERIRFALDVRAHRLIAKNKALKKASKRTCFIIGNGPSLSEVNLQDLTDYDTFTVNDFHRDIIELANFSNYHVMIDNAYYTDEYIGYVRETVKKCTDTKFIFSYKGRNALKDLKDSSRVFFVYQRLVQHGNFLKLDMTKNMTTSVNVVLAAIQCAIYMGYNTLYLVGCDFNSYATLKPTHFYESEPTYRINSMGSDLQWSSMAHYHHYALEKYAKSHGISIINATRGSLIDAYERVELASIYHSGYSDPSKGN